ncbi:MAG: MMPL family transporter [Gammaproteobacteria bacterium]
MTEPQRRDVSRGILGRWFDFVHRRAVWVLLLGAVLAYLTLDYALANLRVNTDTADMLSRELPWRKAHFAYKDAFPQYVDTIVVVIEGDTLDEVRDASLKLYERLRPRDDLFHSVYLPERLPFFRENGLLYLDTGELEDLSDNLSRAQPFLAKLQRDPSLHGFFALLTEAVTEVDVDFDLRPTFHQMARTLATLRTGRPERLSWEELMTGKNTPPMDRRAFIIVNPKLDFSAMLPGEPAMQGTRDIARRLQDSERLQVRVRLTGGAALAYEELQSVSLSTQLAGLGSLVLVTLIMALGLRSFWLVVTTLVALLLGLVYTAGFATLAVGQLNLISVAFAIMYIGLGADYAIYLCLRYKELNGLYRDKTKALREAVVHVGGSLILCTITTSIGFFAFLPTAYAGVAELGLISGVGMFISLGVTLTVLPALLSLVPLPAGRERPVLPKLRFPLRWINLPMYRSRAIFVTAAAAALTALLVLPAASFDDNPINLQDPSNESVQTLKDLLAESKYSPWSLVLLAKDAGSAHRLTESLSALPSVEEVVSVESFIPKDQEEKLALIDEMTLSLGPEILAEETERPAVAHVPPDVSSLEEFQIALSAYVERTPAGDLRVSAERLSRELAQVITLLRQRDPAGRTAALGTLEHSLIDSLQGRLASLRESMRAHPVDLDDLPAELKDRWVSKDGVLRIEVFPKMDLDDPAAMRHFVEEVRELAPDATGAPVNYIEGGNAVVTAFKQAFLYSTLVIIVVLALSMRRKSDILLVLAPLLLAALLTGAAFVLLGIPFNFANIIALPLLLGMGVDNGIHMVHRFRTAPPTDGNLLRTSTARAVVLSALTNTSAFISLAASPHRGTASMGVLLTIGITLTLLCTLVVLPSLIAVLKEIRGRLRQRRRPV